MGIDAKTLRFMMQSRSTASFERVLTLGRQFTHVSPADIERELKPLGLPSSTVRPIAVHARQSGFFEPIFELMGASKVDSMDFSDYEQATIVHDINDPVAETLKEKFTVVYDGGTLEHVFNFPIAIRNAMEMVAVGGHYLCTTPTNNLSGHGFYQFSPDLIYRIFSESNGFEVEELCVAETRPHAPMYRIEDPMKLGHRVMFTNSYPVYLMARARRIAKVPIFQTTPQQTYYETKWTGTGGAAAARESLRAWAKRSLPTPVKNVLRRFGPQQVRPLDSSGFQKL